MKFKLLRSIIAASIAISLGACGGGGDSSSTSQPTSPVNTAPVANAGPAQTVVIGSSVTLNGNASNDAEKDPLTYSWTLSSKPIGSSASLPSSTSIQPSFTPDVIGDYVATLVVNDGKLSSVASTVTVTAKAVPFSSLPPASAPVEGTLTDWLISKTTSPLTGLTTTILNASSLEGDFIITCTGDGNFSYYFKTTSVTANGAIQMRVGTNPIISETWLESSSGGYRLLVPTKINTDLLQKFYKNWDFVFQYNGYSTGVQTAENGSAGFSSAIDKTRADCKWSTDLFPPQNGWGKALPTVPPDDAIEATDLSGLDITKRVRLIAWKALNSSGKPQILVRMGDAANNNVAMGSSDNRLYVTQDGKTVSAVSGFSFNNSASKPLIFALNGDYDASRPLTLTMMAFHFHTTDKLTPVAEVKFSQ
ncbi:PKD domain-containing protein [Duganella margarita]|uniref:PKD domain-containing protein n=1 Tax=Duganella margarita TaxID=2692170 RepID=UPI001927588D|nr:PKD domain-containing protein [Duganella margarita]